MKKLKRALLNWFKAVKAKRKITKYCKYNDIRVAQEDLSRLKFHITGKNNSIHIGNHVWVGAYASIMKNVYIADDCIVGWGSVVSGKFDTSNCVLAGNPAKLVRQGITWEANGAQCGYIENTPASHQQ